MKKLLMWAVCILIWGVANATNINISTGVSYTVINTSSSTPYTITGSSAAGYFIDMSYRATAATTVTGPLLIVDQGQTICNDTPASGNGGWTEMQGWSYPAPQTQTTHTIVFTDVNNVGFNITVKCWNGYGRTTRPQ